MKTKDLDPKALRYFQDQLKGELITPKSDRYTMFKRVYNAMIDYSPALIVRCENIADILYSLDFSKTYDIPIAIRSGGHHLQGLSSADSALVIDLTLLNGIQVDLKFNTIRVEAGCLLGDIDHALTPFGKAFPTGNHSSIGISGLTLGGGFGHLSRAYGLTMDSLIEADIVLADGRLITIDQHNFPELFWAIRGGGGNFGIVTSYLFELHPAGAIQGGPMLWPIEEAQHILPFYRDFILRAPNEISCYFTFLTIPPLESFPKYLHLKKMCGLVWCNLGNPIKSNQAIAQFRELKTPVLDYVNIMPYSQLQSLFDEFYPSGLQWHGKAIFLKDLSKESIHKNINYAKLLPTPHSFVHFYPVNGACHFKKNNETAWEYRQANWAQLIAGVDPDPANKDKITNWVNSYLAAIRPFSFKGEYLNFITASDQLSDSYGSNYEKLQRIKKKYDPRNLFRINQNIRP